MKTWIKYILFIITGFTISCSNNINQTEKISEEKVFEPPITVVAKKPRITLLDTCPPQVVTVPQKTGGSYTKRLEGNTQIIKLLPPTVTKAGFYVTMKQYNVEEGLALSALPSSYCDSKGNLWFGTTSGGVSEFDGKTFTNFTRNQGLVDDQVFSIFQDKNATMWFGTWNGVTSYDGKRFRQFTFYDDTTCCRFVSLAQDKEGYIWVGTDGGGAAKLKGKPYENYSPKNGLSGYSVYCILKDRNGNLWFGTENGVSRYDGKTFKNFRVQQGLSSNKVRAIKEDSDGNIWLGTSNGLSKFNGASFKNFSVSAGLISNNVTSLLLDKNNHLWIGTTNGVSEFDGTEFKNYTVENGLISNSISTMVQDNEENIWFTTDGEGIFKYSGNAFISYSKAQGLPTNSPNCVIQQTNGNYWFGTYDKGAVEYNGKIFTTYSVNQGLADSTVLCIYEDKRGDIWFSTRKGVSCFDGKTFTTYTTAQGLAVNVVYNVAEDTEGNLWFATFGGGISMLSKNRQAIKTYTAEQGIYGNANVHEIIVDRKQNKWLCNDAGGVTRFDDKTFTTYTDKQGLSVWGSLAAFEDTHGNLWFGCGEGVARYDGTSFKYFKEGLVDKEIWDIKEDSEGNIWVGGRAGVSRLELKEINNPNAINRIIKSDTNVSNNDFTKNLKASFNNYNFKNGYPVRDIAYTNSMFFDKENSLWIATSNKLIRFQYNKLHKNLNPPNAFIKQVKLNNESIAWNDLSKDEEKPDSNIIPAKVAEETFLYGQQLDSNQQSEIQKKFSSIQFDSITPYYPIPQNLVLPYKCNDITFEFSAIETTRPDFLNFQYILEGYSNNWSSVSNERTASFGNIHEGTYTFKLKAQNSNGVWGNIISYKFKVLPPWYRSWWAYTLYILVFLAALWSFIKWRISALRKEKTLLEKKVVQRTHELQEEKEKVESTLSELKLTQAQLIQSEKMASLGELTAGIAHEIQNPLNFVNNFSEVNKELISELKEEMKKGNIDEANTIADNLEDNEEKINHHGKRADAIVKGMLQHSRATSSKKEPTDINALTDEYLRLSYHGFRAKDKSFSATIPIAIGTDFDSSIGKINIVPQDIGRVLLNLLNNAFYAVMQKNASTSSAGQFYEPTVSVSTKKIDGKISISVKDNGTGISQKVVDKIFQPFFTTKPTGEGTGLGLSLAYDIIKAHGGELQVQTKESEFSEFVIILLKT